MREYLSDFGKTVWFTVELIGVLYQWMGLSPLAGSKNRKEPNTQSETRSKT